MADAWAQRVVVQLPGMSPGTKALFIHQRVLPAFQQVVANLQAEAAAGHTYPVYDNYTWSWAAYTIPRKGTSRSTPWETRSTSTRTGTRIEATTCWSRTCRTGSCRRGDAGWCWGGDWQTIKDAMHFAWKGPLFTPGFEMPPPQPPLVAAADLTAEVALTVGLIPTTESPHLVADLDRDGAVDVVRIQPIPGGVALVTAAARYAFAKPQVLAVTTVPPSGSLAPVDLADLNRDGRPDLVYILDNAGSVAFEVFPLIQSGILTSQMIATPIPYEADSVYRFDDMNRDGYTDVFMILATSPARLSVWLGPTSPVMARPLHWPSIRSDITLTPETATSTGSPTCSPSPTTGR